LLCSLLWIQIVFLLVL